MTKVSFSCFFTDCWQNETAPTVVFLLLSAAHCHAMCEQCKTQPHSSFKKEVSSSLIFNVHILALITIGLNSF